MADIRQRCNVWGILREKRFENLVEQQRDGISDFIRQRTVRVRKIDSLNLLVDVDTVGNAAFLTLENNLLRGGKVVVSIHFVVALCRHGEVRIQICQPDAADIAHRADFFRNLCIGDTVFADLTVRRSAVDMVCRSSDEHLTVIGCIQHFVILAAVCKKLSRQKLLVNMIAQLRAEIVALTLFVLGNIARRFQGINKAVEERFVDDAEAVLQLAAIKTVSVIACQHLVHR